TLFWDRYDVSLTVQPDGALRVVETQTITFTSGSFTFGYASIPLDKTGGISEVAVSEGGRHLFGQRGSGTQPYTFTAEEAGGKLDIRWYFPATANSTHTYVLSYAVRGAVRIYEGGDKLQWIAISGERDFPIQDAQVTVNLPAGARFQIVDSAGVAAHWTKNAPGNSVTYVAQQGLYGSDSLEVGVEFTHGVVPAVKPAWQAGVDQSEYYDLHVRPIANLLLGALGALLALAAPLAVYLLWYLRGRDPQVGPVPEYLSQPPGDLPPGVIGTLVDERADMRDIVATLVDLARRGYLEMEETRTKGAFGTHSTDHVFRRKKEFGGLTHFEGLVVRGVFRKGIREVKLNDLRQKFYTSLPAIQTALYDDLVSREFFTRSPEKTRSAYRGWGIAFLVGTVVLGFFALPALGQYAGAIACPFGGLAILGLGLMTVGGRMPAKTRRGAEEAARWKAFEKYLRKIETLTDLKSAGELFDRYLPFAIAFGIDQSWVSKFSRVEGAPVPGWYVPYGWGHGVPGAARRGLASPARPSAAGGVPSLQGMSDGMAGGLQSMSTGLTNMLNSAGRVLGSVPQSSGSSGWSGGGGFSSGGFSSGGGGGGGGRGFG
ncbi:MAG: DUF2207 domain-containing protein, partial [Chloroflexi bacterium]|nr:DUF2207 domain-containing protein [Chloroflexota bacterium]